MTFLQIKQLSKAELKILISQLEIGMEDLLANKEIEKAAKLNLLIGNCISLYTKK